MTRARLRASDGFSLIEVMVASLILIGGIFALVASLSVFRAQASDDVARAAATHEAQQELEYLRSLGYRSLVLKSAPAASTGPRDPRSGVSGGSYRPSADAPYSPMLIDATADGAVDQSRPWSAGRTSGTLDRFITQEPAGTAGCGQICPRRVSVGVMYTFNGRPHSGVMSTLVADPQAGSADETSVAPTPAAAACPCWSTLYLYDTLAENTERVEPSADHLLQKVSSGGQNRKRTDYPLLMGLTAPPNPFTNNTSAPFEPTRYRYATDLEASDGLGQTYPAGTLIKESGGCNEDADDKKSARWTTRPVLEDTVLSGDASAQIFTRLAGNLTGNGWLCFTFYDWTIDGTGHVGTKTKLLSFGINQNPWPSGTPQEIDTDTSRYLAAGTTRTLVAGHALGVEVTINDLSAGTEAVYYDHPAFASSIQVSTSPALK